MKEVMERDEFLKMEGREKDDSNMNNGIFWPGSGPETFKKLG